MSERDADLLETQLFAALKREEALRAWARKSLRALDLLEAYLDHDGDLEAAARVQDLADRCPLNPRSPRHRATMMRIARSSSILAAPLSTAAGAAGTARRPTHNTDLLNALFDAPPADLVTVVDGQLAIISVRVHGDRVALERTKLGALPMSLNVLRELLDGGGRPALETDVETCEYCGKEFHKGRGAATHRRWCRLRTAKALDVRVEEVS